MKFSSKVFFSLISATFIFAAGCDDSTTKCTAKCDGQTALSCDKNGKETKKACTAEQKCEVNTKANTASCKAKNGGNGGGNGGGGNSGTGGDYKDCDATQAAICEGLTGVKCLVAPNAKKTVICAIEPEESCNDSNMKECSGGHLKTCWLTNPKDASKGGKATLRKCADGCENNQCKGSGTYTDCNEQQKKSCEGLENTKCQVAPNGTTVLCFKEPEEKCGQGFKDSCKGEGASAVATRCWKTNLSDAEGRINFQKCKNGCDAKTGKCAKK